MQIIPYGEPAGKEFPQKNAGNCSKTGIGEAKGNKETSQKIDGHDSNTLFQNLRNGRNQRFLHTQKKSPKAGTGSHEGNSKGQQAQGVRCTGVFYDKGSDFFGAKKQKETNEDADTKRKKDRLFHDAPDISVLSADMFLGGQAGDGCCEAGGGDAPCQSVDRQDQLIQPHAFGPDGVGKINAIKKTHAFCNEVGSGQDQGPCDDAFTAHDQPPFWPVYHKYMGEGIEIVVYKNDVKKK